MVFNLAFHPLARDDLFSLYDYIAERAGFDRAGGYIDRIERRCLALQEMPERGRPRPDLGRDVRTLAMERRVLIVYRAGASTVEILRVVYAGRQFSADDLPA